MSFNILEQNPFIPSYFVAPPTQSTRWVITDIHGSYKTFKRLLKKIGLHKSDQLFLLGDYIDKGANDKKVLKRILKLIDEGYQVYPLRGNHEERLIRAHHKTYSPELLRLPYAGKNRGIINKHRNIKPKYLPLLSALPYYYELDHFFLVHAGFDFSYSEPFMDYDSMLWLKKMNYHHEKAKGKTIIYGHHSDSLENIKKSIKNRDKIIALDNGCVYKSQKGYGNLLALNLDTFVLVVQPNIET